MVAGREGPSTYHPDHATHLLSSLPPSIGPALPSRSRRSRVPTPRLAARPRRTGFESARCSPAGRFLGVDPAPPRQVDDRQQQVADLVPLGSRVFLRFARLHSESSSSIFSATSASRFPVEAEVGGALGLPERRRERGQSGGHGSRAGPLPPAPRRGACGSPSRGAPLRPCPRARRRRRADGARASCERSPKRPRGRRTTPARGRSPRGRRSGRAGPRARPSERRDRPRPGPRGLRSTLRAGTS